MNGLVGVPLLVFVCLSVCLSVSVCVCLAPLNPVLPPVHTYRKRKCADTVGTVLVPCMGWLFPMLKYKYIFRIKYTEALGNCYGLKLPKC